MGLSTKAYDEIKGLILNSEIKPGQFITETEMQERLNLGRTPVREAFQALARDQLVTIHARRGIEVSTISPKRIREIFEVRKMLEPNLLYDCADLLDRQWLSKMRDEMGVFVDKDAENLDAEIIKLANIDDQFHRKITDFCENSYIDRLLDSMFDYLTMIRVMVSHNVERFNQSNKEHVTIIDNIVKGDKEKAREAMYTHLQNSLEATLNSTLDGKY